MSRRTGRPTYAASITPSPGRQPWAKIWKVAAGLLATLAAGVLIGTQLAGPSAAESAVASLREQDAARDKDQIAELTAKARQTATSFSPIVEGLANPGTATTAQVTQWKQLIGKEVQWFSEAPSGTTATNVARGGLRTAVDQLAIAVDLAAYALTQPEGARQAAWQLVSRQRDLAVAGWSVAATQLDQINIDAGYGHQHVYLTNAGGSGVMTDDGLPEGTKR